MPIPELNSHGELDAGEHEASLDEIEAVYGSSSEKRKALMMGLREATKKLEQAGVQKLWVNGSFITNKDTPNDIDGCWEYNDGIDLDLLMDDFLHPNSREIVMQRYGLDFFIAQVIEAGSDKPFPKFFQVNRNGTAKGIIVVRLGGSL